MCEQNGDKPTPDKIISATTELIKAVPLYQDLLQEGAQEVGKALGTAGRAVNTALMPIRILIWKMEHIEEYLKTKVKPKLEKVPPENIRIPDPALLVSVIESLRLNGHKESISDLYASLLATSMDSTTAQKAHPGFVEVLKQLSPDEAKLLSLIPTLPRYPDICSVRVHSSWAWGQMVYSKVREEFLLICEDANLDHPNLARSYLDNMRRLLLLEFRQDVPGKVIDVRLGQEEIETDYVEYISVTDFGQQFLSACVG